MAKFRVKLFQVRWNYSERFANFDLSRLLEQTKLYYIVTVHRIVFQLFMTALENMEVANKTEQTSRPAFNLSPDKILCISFRSSVMCSGYYRRHAVINKDLTTFFLWCLIKSMPKGKDMWNMVSNNWCHLFYIHTYRLRHHLQ